MKTYETGVVESVTCLAPMIYDMKVKAKMAADAVPGQFVMIYPHDKSTLLPRPISICEACEGVLRFVFRIAGKGTKEFSDYKAGDSVRLLGPLGNGYNLETMKGKRVMVMGGGIGVPPMLELMKQLNLSKIDVKGVFGYRDSNLFLKEDFEKYVVVAGYGWCGKGVSMRAKGLGAKLIVTEVNPVRALEAHMDGFEVMSMDQAAEVGDIFVTVTGCDNIITPKHFEKIKDGAILCNAGHFDVEVDVASLRKMAVKTYQARENIEGFVLENGKTLFVIGEGRLVNLAAGDGHPAEIMDMSFAIQALSAEWLAKHKEELKPGVVPVPEEIDKAVAERKLATLGKKIGVLTEEQKQYLGL